MILMRRRYMDVRSSALDWEGLAKALIDPSIPFDITGFEVNPEYDGVLYNKRNLTGTLTLKGGATIVGVNAFYYCSGITDVIIPEGVTKIRYFAFYGCSGLTHVTLPSTCTLLETGNIFSSCTNLESINLPEGITTIPTYLFHGSNKLEHITLPSTLQTIKGSGLFNCGIKEITIPSGVTSMEAQCLNGCRKLKEVIMEPTTPPTLGTQAFGIGTYYVLEAIYVPDASVNAYKTANNWSTYESYIKPISERVV
mgnify:CR=1 FL=1